MDFIQREYKATPADDIQTSMKQLSLPPTC